MISVTRGSPSETRQDGGGSTSQDEICADHDHLDVERPQSISVSEWCADPKLRTFTVAHMYISRTLLGSYVTRSDRN